MILVTGSTGTVGSEVVKQLANAGHKVRALVRNPKDASGKFPTTVDVAVGDLDNPDTLWNAMKGVEQVYLLVPLSPTLQKHDRNAIDAAKRAGIKHVVKHSVLGAQYEGITLAKWHRAGEKALESSGIAWTHIRPSGFFTNTLGWAKTIKEGGTVYYPTGNGKLGIIDPRDIAAVALKTLTTPGHDGKSYDLTGPAALSTQEQVDWIGRAIGKPLKFVDVPDAAAKDAMLKQGWNPQLADLMLEFTNLIKAGQAALITDWVQKVSGKPPRTFEAWATENASAFR